MLAAKFVVGFLAWLVLVPVACIGMAVVLVPAYPWIADRKGWQGGPNISYWPWQKGFYVGL